MLTLLTKNLDFPIIFSVNSEIFIFNLLSKTKEDAVMEILKAFEIDNFQQSYEDIMKREALSSTLINPIIAIPHSKSRCVNKLTYAVARSVDGVSWNEGRAKIIILTLSPVNASGEHVIFLSHVARILENKDALDRLLSATSADEMEEVFSDYDT